jgi:hypothetical protein
MLSEPPRWRSAVACVSARSIPSKRARAGVFGMGMAASLRKDARDVLIDRIRRDEEKLRRKTLLSRERRLFRRDRRAERRLDRERGCAIDVIEDESLTLFRNRASHFTRNRAIAPEHLSAAIVDVERVDAESGDRKIRRLAAAGRSGDHDHARPRHFSPRLERRV